MLTCVAHLARRCSVAAMMLEETLGGLSPPCCSSGGGGASASAAHAATWARTVELVQRCASTDRREVRLGLRGQGD